MAILKKKTDTAVLEKAVHSWMGAYVKWCAIVKPIEVKLDEAKGKVASMMRASGLDAFESKMGRISLQTKVTTDWEALARTLLKEEVINENIEKFKKESDPFLRAPQAWAGKAK